MIPSPRILVTAATLLLSFLAPVKAMEGEFTLSIFKADVTPPVGHMLFTGNFKPSIAIETPLEARGFVLQTKDQKPLVVCSVDWSEIRNESYDYWRDKLAEGAGTSRERDLVSSVHQHDTPLDDLGAERALRELGSKHQVIDPQFRKEAVSRVVLALKNSLADPQPITHIGTGRAKVEKIASNRRYLLPDGTPKYDRGSACKILTAQRAPVGAIDPYVHTLSFWNEKKNLLVYSVYATHPMSYYGTGRINADFPGLARTMLEDESPDTFQIYASGCSGNVTAGKYNNGNPANRIALAERLFEGMKSASRSTTRQELSSVSFLNQKLKVKPRTSPNFSREALTKTIKENEDARTHLLASLGLSWLDRVENEGSEIDIPSMTFNDGAAQIILLPGEIYVNYQLFAQSLAPERFLLTPGYGESAPGYIPFEMHWQENDHNLNTWCWVDPGMEKPIKEVLRKLIKP